MRLPRERFSQDLFKRWMKNDLSEIRILFGN